MSSPRAPRPPRRSRGDRRRKTGTAETATGQAPHAWFISFAPAEDPKVALALIVESGSAGGEASGGHTAAPIAKSVIEAVLGK
ncbi:penicillin-binding transpeptidase domain-containing protein [Streptosporangium lutulentum]